MAGIAKVIGEMFTAGKLLVVLFLFSLYQYNGTGQVNWLTDSFRWIESTATQFLRDPQGSLERTAQALSDYSLGATRAVSSAVLPSAITGQADMSWSTPSTMQGSVVEVVSGDTLVVLDTAATRKTVRLEGIDAPEEGQPHWRVSRERLSAMVAGKEVNVVSYGTDPSGYLYGKVWVQPADCPRCGQTLNVGLAQLTTGMARWRRDDASRQASGDRGRYAFAEDDARARRRGLWADPDPLNLKQ